MKFIPGTYKHLNIWTKSKYSLDLICDVISYHISNHTDNHAMLHF